MAGEISNRVHSGWDEKFLTFLTHCMQRGCNENAMNPAETARKRQQNNQQHESKDSLRRNSLDGHLRSKSDGSRRFPRRHNVTRNSSTESSANSLDVRCACQYFQGDSLFPNQRIKQVVQERNNLFTPKKVVFQKRYVISRPLEIHWSTNMV